MGTDGADGGSLGTAGSSPELEPDESSLLAAFPPGVKEMADKNILPIHLAASSQAASVELINLLLAADPEGVKAIRLLFFAITGTAPLEVVRHLLALYPEAASTS